MCCRVFKWSPSRHRYISQALILFDYFAPAELGDLLVGGRHRAQTVGPQSINLQRTKKRICKNGDKPSNNCNGMD